MKSVRLTHAARHDIEEITRHTAQTWGPERKRIYLDAIRDCFLRLKRFPDLGTPRDDLAPGFRSVQVGHHIAFYRQTDTDIVVVRVLHERMDVHRHLDAEK